MTESLAGVGPEADSKQLFLAVGSWSKNFAGVHVVPDVSLHVLGGEIHSLEGVNGRGQIHYSKGKNRRGCRHFALAVRPCVCSSYEARGVPGGRND